MSDPRPRYAMTLAELRRHCHLLASIDVAGSGRREGLIGKNAAGEILVQVWGVKVTPKLVEKFKDEYHRARAAGVLRPVPAPVVQAAPPAAEAAVDDIPTEEEPHA